MSRDPLTILASENEGRVEPLIFTTIEYSTFKAEFAIDQDDYIFHFFPPKSPPDTLYWDKIFPAVLDPVAQNVFKATYPRLKAARIKDFGIDSWWMRAYGFTHGVSPSDLAYRFMNALDEALDKKNDK